jgi:hypothetical protein
MEFKDINPDTSSSKQNVPEIGNIYYIKRSDGSLRKEFN